MNNPDPFLQVQADVQTQLTTIRPLYTSYLRILSLTPKPSTQNPNPSPSPELTSARTDLLTTLTTLNEDLQDLHFSILAIQSDPYKYGLEIEEVTRRKRFVDAVSQELASIQEALDGNGSTNQNGNGNGNGKGKSYARPGDDLENGLVDPDTDEYAQFEQQQQLTIMAEQDQTLTSVFHTVGNLRQQANEMGRELEEQAVMLNVTDELADRVQGRLSTGMEKMKVVIRRNEDGLSSCCIAVLIFVLVLLLVLVLVL